MTARDLVAASPSVAKDGESVSSPSESGDSSMLFRLLPAASPCHSAVVQIRFCSNSDCCQTPLHLFLLPSLPPSPV